MVDRFPPLRPEDPKQVAAYALRARLGAGGMGSVYLSFSPGGYPLAIKVVKRAFADDPEFRARFRREIAAALRVQGYYTAPVRDAGPDDEIPWYATAYIAGPSLEAAGAEHGPLPVFSVFRLLAGAAEGIAAVHAAGLVHRDLKPGNVLLAEDGPRVIDFGLARADSYSRLTGTGVSVGTPAYMAPEQVRGRVSEATDVFALGHLALFAATGHSAFGADNADALFYRLLNEPPDLEGCPGELRAIVANCLTKDPVARPGLDEVTAFASAAVRSRLIRTGDRAWLPQSLAESLSDYSAGNAPSSRPLAEPPAPETQTDIAAARAVARRSLLRPVILIPAALLVAVGAVLGFVAGHTSGTATGAAAPATSASPPAQAASPSAAPPAHQAAAGSASAGAAPDDGYTRAYAGYAFTMPGGNCTAALNPSDVVLAGPQPFVDTRNDGQDGDMEIHCAAYPEPTSEAELTFSDTAAQVSGTPSAAACLHAASTAPIVGPVSYQRLHAGSQFCLTTTNSATKKTWVTLVTLRALNKVSDDLAWTATAWYGERPAS